MVTWKTASDLFAFERTTRVVLPCHGCHRYETITSVPWAFLRVLVSRFPDAPCARQGCAGAQRGAASGTRQGRSVSRSRRTPPPILPSGGLTIPDSCLVVVMGNCAQEPAGLPVVPGASSRLPTSACDIGKIYRCAPTICPSENGG
jgi:hypothetical protein